MNIVFFGTSEFAVPSLERLIRSNHKISAVVTQPDKKRGRFQKVAASAVKESALKFNLAVLQPDDIGDVEFIERLKSFGADLFAVASYGNILKKQILKIPKKFCINLHASLLPRYRGAAPINWAIINGDEVSGVTIIKMNEKMDEGDIILEKELSILTSDTAESLSRRLSYEGSGLLIEAMGLIERDRAEFKKQDNNEATYAPRLKKEDGLIDWNKEALSIQNRIRGVLPWPGAYTYFNGKPIKVWKVSAYGAEEKGNPGDIIGIEKDGILVSTGKGAIVIEELQPDSSRRMDVNAFLAGHKVKAGDVFTSSA